MRILNAVRAAATPIAAARPSRDVGDQDEGAIGIERDQVVEVPTDAAGWTGLGMPKEPSARRSDPGQGRALDSGGELELRVGRDAFLLEGGELSAEGPDVEPKMTANITSAERIASETLARAQGFPCVRRMTAASKAFARANAPTATAAAMVPALRSHMVFAEAES